MINAASGNNKDYLVIGQGLCGTMLSWQMMKAGKTVLVVDDNRSGTASKVASGVINPVTGRRIVRTWRIEELLPFAWNAYNELGNALKADLIQQCNILDFHASLQMKDAFAKRLPEETDYLKLPESPDQWKQYFNYHFGVGEISPCYLIDLQLMLEKWRQKLADEKSLIQEYFDMRLLQVHANGVVYKDQKFEKIIFCDGVAGFSNPFFKNLPYSRMKGEVIIASIPDLPRRNIYKQGFNIVPWKDDLWWIGSSYEWDFKDAGPTEAFRKKVETQLNNFFKLTYSIIDHWASERPANMERRPFVGLHPAHNSVGVFNGMGAKGCSLAPFFAKQLVEFLVEGKPIYPDADVQRFNKVLMRSNVSE